MYTADPKWHTFPMYPCVFLVQTKMAVQSLCSAAHYSPCETSQSRPFLSVMFASAVVSVVLSRPHAHLTVKRLCVNFSPELL